MFGGRADEELLMGCTDVGEGTRGRYYTVTAIAGAVDVSERNVTKTRCVTIIADVADVIKVCY